MIVRRKEATYGLVVMWASLGIATKQATSSIIYLTALLVVGVIAAAIIMLPVLRKKGFKSYYLE